MSQDVISSHEQLSMDEITSPLTAQIFDFCDPQLFQETFNQASEVTSASNCGYVENNNNNFTEKSNGGSNQDHEDNNNNNADLSIIFDSQDDFDNDITASIDFSSSIQFPVSDHQLQDQFDFTGIQLHQPPNILYSSSSGDPLPPPLSVFEEDCLSSVPSYNLGSINPTSPSCSFLSNPGLPAYMSLTGNIMNTGLAFERSGFYSGSLQLGSDFKPTHDQLMEIQADNGGMFCQDSIKPILNPVDHQLQGLDGGENQNHMAAPPVLPQLGTEITGLDDGSFNKVGKLSAEQRKEKISRYMKKRNERNFSKKIKVSVINHHSRIKPLVIDKPIYLILFLCLNSMHVGRHLQIVVQELEEDLQRMMNLVNQIDKLLQAITMTTRMILGLRKKNNWLILRTYFHT